MAPATDRPRPKWEDLDEADKQNEIRAYENRAHNLGVNTMRGVPNSPDTVEGLWELRRQEEIAEVQAQAEKIAAAEALRQHVTETNEGGGN